MKKRGLCRIAAGLLAAVLLAGCGARKTGGARGFTPKLDTAAKIQLDALGFFGNFEALDQVTNDFNKYYPNITFSYQQVSGSSLENYLDLNPGADIIMVSPEFMTPRSATLPQRCMDLTNIDISAIDEQMLQLYSFGGIQKAIPMSQNVTGMVVNTTLLEKEGLTVPTNRQEFLSTLAALKEKGYTPLQGPAGKVLGELTLNSLSCALCADEELLKKAKAGDSAAMDKLLSLFAFMDTVLDNGYTDMALNATLPEDNYDGAILHFFEGNTPFWLCNSEKVSGMKKRESKSEIFQQAPFTYTFAYVPLGEDGCDIYQEPWFGFAVHRESKHPEYAMEFLRFLATKSEIETMANVKGVPSVAREPNVPPIYQRIESPQALEKRAVNTGAVPYGITQNWYNCTRAYAEGAFDSPESAIQHFLNKVC